MMMADRSGNVNDENFDIDIVIIAMMMKMIVITSNLDH